MPRTRKGCRLVLDWSGMAESLPETSFALYRLQSREAAAFAVLAVIVILLSLLAFVGGGKAGDVPLVTAPAAPARVFVNRAGVAELAALPGIGVRKAERIIEARGRQPLQSLPDLAQAAGGISQANLERMREFVSFDEREP